MTIIQDLGAITGPLAIAGGAYSNWPALKVFDNLVAKMGLAAHQVIHTGDVIAYCAEAKECLDHLMASNWHAIAGNVEQQLGAKADDCGCGFEEGSACEQASHDWFAYANSQIDETGRGWCARLPDQMRFTLNGVTVQVVHGSVSDTSQFVFASTPDTEFARQFAFAPDADVVIAGHSGIPFAKTLPEGVWVNTGALGMPANDGTPRGWYGLVEPTPDGVEVSVHPFDYDHKSAASAMRAARLPKGYADALETGLWPALDVLDQSEIEQTGTPLAHFSIRATKRIVTEAAE